MNSNQISLLTKGPKFCPTTKGNYLNTKVDISEFTRKLKLKDIFHGHDNNDISLIRKKSSFNPITKNQELTKIIDIIEKSEPLPINMINNLTQEEEKL